jgi:hypothetical protein
MKIKIKRNKPRLNDFGVKQITRCHNPKGYIRNENRKETKDMLEETYEKEKRLGKY